MHPRQRIPDPNRSSPKHARDSSALAAHRVVAARTEQGLHARAGMALARGLEQRGAELEPVVLQREQVDPGDDDVAAEQLRRDEVAAEEAGDGGEILASDQADMPRPAAAV